MSINPKCDFCDVELNEMGAILLSPPVDHTVTKFHICKECYVEILKNLGTKSCDKTTEEVTK